jgi:fructose-1,6-bisphosphatase
MKLEAMKLDAFLNQHCSADQLKTNLPQVLLAISQACIVIAETLRQGAMAGVTNKLSAINVQGETQMQLDLESHQVVINALKNSNLVAAVLSEEAEDVVMLDANAPWLIATDPLDGSSNLAINGVVGSIFSLLPNSQQGTVEQRFLQPGRLQSAACYVMYGPATNLILSVGNGTHSFTLNPTNQSFELVQSPMVIAAETNEFAINASNQRYWQPAVKRYIDECLLGKDGVRQKDFNMRWCASMVADVYRVLCRGGVFMYPKDSKLPLKAGRLRLLYEANPMSFLIEQAQGLSCDGERTILDIDPSSLHQRVPVMLGAKAEIERLLAYHRANHTQA